MSEVEITYDLKLLEQSQLKWQRSSALRAVYNNIFAAMAAECGKGRSLELGSGIGVAPEIIPDLVTSDLVKTRYVERAVSAYEIPPEQWANILAMDTLHHLQRPFEFFASAAKALADGGRIVLMEPAGTPWGRFFYGLVHPEPCLPAQINPPFDFPTDANGEFANMGMGVGLLNRHQDETARRLRELGLSVRKVTYRDFFAYPATGGGSGRSMLPAGVLKAILAVEKIMPQVLMQYLALRMIIVIEKQVGIEPGSA